MIKKIIICYILFCNNLFAGTIRPDVPDEKYIEHGLKYDCVVQIWGKLKENPKLLASGSGVVIHKNWLLTAAHVMDCMENPYFIINEKKYNIIKIIPNKNFNISAPISNGDLAACFVDEEIKINKFPKLYYEKDEISKFCDLVGYGVVGLPFLGEEKRTDNKRRAGTNKIMAISEFVIFCEMKKENQSKLEFLTSFGDSGGGLFIDEKLAGIHSFVSCKDGKADSSYGDESGHTRISAYKDWLDEIIK